MADGRRGGFLSKPTHRLLRLSPKRKTARQMLGRSARGNRKPGPDYPTETRSPHRSAYNRRRSGPRHRRTKRKRDRPYRHYPRYPSHCGGCPQQALEAITKGNEAERGQGQFTTLRVSEGKARERSLPSGSQSLQTINCELCILNCELTLSRLRLRLEYATAPTASVYKTLFLTGQRSAESADRSGATFR